MRIRGLRIGAPIARLLTQILGEAGFVDTAAKITQAIELQVTTEDRTSPSPSREPCCGVHGRR